MTFLVFLSHQVRFCPFHNTRIRSPQRNNPCIYCHDLIPTTESSSLITTTEFLPFLLFMINFVLLNYSLRKFSFISLSLIFLFSKIPRYLYPFSSTSLILSPSAYLLLQMTLLSLFSLQVHYTSFSQSPSQYHYLIFIQWKPIHLLHAHSLERSLSHP